MKQVVRSLSTWMQALIPTSAGKPTRRKGSVRLKPNACECLELRALPAALIGVDFGPATESPKNWKNFGDSTNGTVTNLTDESGVASTVSLNIKYADGQGGGVNPTFAASQLPKHTQSLRGLNGAIRDDSKITLTFNNLTASGLYEVYVFGGSTQADTQYITLAGSGQSQKFSQILDPGKLVVNGLAGSSGKDLSAYAKKVTATSSGQITISAEGVELPECSLAGVAIRPVLPDIQLNSVTSDGESNLTVKYTIKTAAVKPFRIAAYSSKDTLFSSATDTLAGFVQISNAADLTPGLHTKVYQIGQQFKLPGAGSTAADTDNYLLFVADDNKLVPEDDKDPFNEDNKSVFSGAYVGGQLVTVFGSAGADKFTISSVGQTINVSSTNVNGSYSSSKISRVVVQAGGGVDEVLAASLTVRLTAYGGAGNDRLVGSKADDVLVGGAGDDTLDGGAGIDSLAGGDGDDHLSGGLGSDVYQFALATSREVDTVDEKTQPGVDTLDFSILAASTPVRADLDYRSAGTTIATHTNRIVKAVSEESLQNWENITGTKGDDVILGNDADNRFMGLGGNDLLKGHDGKDDLSGGTGNDKIYDGDENDTLDGGDGDDFLFSGKGDDRMLGGSGSDVYQFFFATSPEVDTVDEKAQPGVDTLDFSVLAASTPVRVDLDYRSAGSTIATHTNRTVKAVSEESLRNWENVTGTQGDDVILGNDADNRFVGNSGNDMLKGHDGKDDLRGGIGNDKIYDGDENDTLDGGDGNDFLFSGKGDDRMLGGSGSDVYQFFFATSPEVDTVDEKAQPGVDTLDFSVLASSTPVRVNLEYRHGQKEIATHTNRTVLVVENESLQNWENVIGTKGDDVILGNDADNRFEGNAGNDLLKGHNGKDDLRGGIGDDKIYAGDENDTLDGGDGNDFLYADSGNDILVGGRGADELNGGKDQDIVISGPATAFDTEAGRLAVGQVWFSNLTLAQKVDLIRSGVGAPAVKLTPRVNVQNDGLKDVFVKGGSGTDWLFYRAVEDTFSGEAGDILELL